MKARLFCLLFTLFITQFPLCSRAEKLSLDKVFLWSEFNDFIARDTTLICVMDHGIEIINIANPESLRLLGQYYSLHDCDHEPCYSAPVLYNNFLFMTQYDCGLSIFDISDLTSPRLAMKIPGDYRNLSISDSIIVAIKQVTQMKKNGLDTNCVELYKVGSDPLPVLIGQYYGIVYLWQIAFSTKSIIVGKNQSRNKPADYLSEQVGSLIFIDPENPGDYSAGIEYKFDKQLLDLSVRRDTAYAILSGKEEQILDIRDPEHIKLLLTRKFENQGWNDNLKLAHDFLFSEPESGRLDIYDINNTERPKYSFDFQQDISFSDFLMKDSLLFGLVDYRSMDRDNNAALVIYKIEDSTHVTYLNDIGENNTFHSLAINGHNAYIVDLDKGVYTINLDKPPLDNPISLFPLQEHYNRPICAFRDYVCVTTQGEDLDARDTSVIIDVSDPRSPTIVNSHSFNGYIEGFYSYDGWLFVLGENNAITVWDVSNVMKSKLISTFPVNAVDPHCMVVRDNYLYTSSGREGMQIVDISDIRNPQYIAGYTPRGGGAIALNGDYAYIAENDGLEIINITDPRNPRFAAKFEPEAKVDSDDKTRFDEIFIDGNYAVLIPGFMGYIYLLDISNPVNPIILDTVGKISSLEDGFMSDGKIYILTYDKFIALEIKDE
jgi:hypothetical protein